MKPTLLALLAPAAGLAAQCPTSEGTFLGAPVALSLSSAGPGTLAASRVYGKRVGFHAVAPGTAAFASGFHFDLHAILSACASTPPPDVDAFSVGLDWILADNATGKVQVPANRWGALTFSVSLATQGRAGGAIRAEQARADGAAADVFSFFLPGSAIPAELVGRTQRAVDSEEIDLGLGRDRRDLDGLDLIVPLFGLEPGMLSLLGHEPRLFFSVAAASLDQCPATWFGGGPKSAATILEVRWNAATGAWTCPQVFLRYDALGLKVEEDVDALAIDLAQQRVLFSTKTPTRNPILFLYYGTDAAQPLPYTDVDDVPIATKIGLLETDDVDAICALDPSIRGGPGGANPQYFAFATPAATAIVPPTAGLSASAFREYVGGQPAIRTFVAGWPKTGAGPGVGALFLTLPGGFNPIVGLGQKARNPMPAFCGDPLTLALPVPADVTLKGAAVYLRWAVADQALTTLGEAHPLQVRL